MLRPLGKLVHFQSSKNVPPLETAAFAGVQVYAEAGIAPAFGICAEAAGTQLQLMGSDPVLSAENVRFDHDDFIFQIGFPGDGVLSISRVQPGQVRQLSCLNAACNASRSCIWRCQTPQSAGRSVPGRYA